jgi:hypothetical protein
MAHHWRSAAAPGSSCRPGVIRWLRRGLLVRGRQRGDSLCDSIDIVTRQSAHEHYHLLIDEHRTRFAY